MGLLVVAVAIGAVLIRVSLRSPAEPFIASTPPIASEELTSAPRRVQRPGHGDDEDGATDFYGNEISDAVARYKLDAAGTLYETHSPQTDMPRLASPKS